MSRRRALADVVGRGLVAGVAGTAAMTLSSGLEARLRRRAPSTAPARATARVLGIAGFQDDLARARFNDLSHWGYGSSWGLVRGLLGAIGLSPPTATLMHGAVVWGSAQVLLPALDVAPPVVFWAPSEIAIDLLHHAVYAVTAGATHELLRADRGGCQAS